MRLIRRISRLRNCGVFHDFTWPSDLLDFGRYNLIYGWNWTGKTTLSRVLRSLELHKELTSGEAIVHIGDTEVRSENFPQSTVQIRVFNRDFISESVFPVGGGDLPPIFVIGKESVEKQKEVEGLKAKLQKKHDELNKAIAEKERADKALDNHCINRARLIKDTLRMQGSKYNDYNKGNYQADAQQMVNDGIAASYRLSHHEREALLTRHRTSQKSKLQEVVNNFPQLKELTDKVSALLRKTVMSATIAALRDDSSLSEWTRQGLLLHKKRRSETCLFCQQPLPQNRLEELEAHFNAEYENFLHEIEEQIQELESAAKQVSEFKLPHRAEFYDDLLTEFETARQEIEQAIKETCEFIEKLINALRDKKARPFKTATLTISVPTVDASAAVNRLNNVIRKHNRACDEFDHRLNEARDRLARDMIAENLNDFIELKREVERASSTVKLIQNQIKELNDKIMLLESEIKEHRQPAEELNEDLRKYLGHGELQLTIKDTGYSITRNGVPASMLSEGEMTAIALLYFLKSLEDRSFDKKNGIVVLDDPVSSLDANSLFLASGFIRERTKDAGQLFVFTHNFQFFRQIRNWFHHLKGQNKQDINKRPARFFMLDCITDKGGRCAVIKSLDPLLERYESEYHYLFARIYRTAHHTSPVNLEENYVLPNMARRMLEAFLAFRKPHISGELWQKLQAVKFDDARKLRIYRFLNTYSHSSDIGEPEHDPTVLAESASVLNDLLDLIKSEDQAHYQAMIKLADPSVNDNQDEDEDWTA